MKISSAIDALMLREGEVGTIQIKVSAERVDGEVEVDVLYVLTISSSNTAFYSESLEGLISDYLNFNGKGPLEELEEALEQIAPSPPIPWDDK
jgi:hypothetical protein